jgi:hypothetical protein
MTGSRRKLCQSWVWWWSSYAYGNTVVGSPSGDSGRRPSRIKTPRHEVDASRRGLTFGSSTSLGPNSRIFSCFCQASPGVLPTASLSAQGVRTTLSPRPSTRPLLQCSLSASSPPVVRVASQHAVPRQRPRSVPSPRPVAPSAHPRPQAAHPGTAGPARQRGLSQDSTRRKILLLAAGLL